ncbi:MAG: DUF389 domain-containing protein [Acidimicrobiales bacterium]
MLHLSVTVPADRAAEIVAHLDGTPGVAHLAHLLGASRRPPGDIVQCDVARECADDLVEWLQAEGIDRDGAITITQLDTVVSKAAERAEDEVPGHGTDALIWDEVEATVREQALLTPSLLVVMAVAAMLAGVGILLDSPILIVGAMVVGPEYGPVAALSVAAVQRRSSHALHALGTLAAAVAAGSVATFVLVLALRATGIDPDGYVLTERQLTAFISRPDALAAVVAVLAGVAGMLALTENRSGTLVGVLVSVTTIPAVANIGVAAAYGEEAEMAGAAFQLSVNLVGLVLAGAATLALQDRLTARR